MYLFLIHTLFVFLIYTGSCCVSGAGAGALRLRITNADNDIATTANMPSAGAIQEKGAASPATPMFVWASIRRRRKSEPELLSTTIKLLHGMPQLRANFEVAVDSQHSPFRSPAEIYVPYTHVNIASQRFVHSEYDATG
jgi:hypothetical protein